jgi:hypothetical protein
MSQLGLEAQADWAPDLTSVRAGFGLDESHQSLTHREIQERRAQVREKFEGHDGGPGGPGLRRRRRGGRS